MTNFITAFSLLFAFSLFSGSTAATPQSQKSDAHLTGTLTDPSGAPIGEAQITAQLESSPSFPVPSAKSTASGEFSLNLPPGNYRLRIVRRSFTVREAEVTLAAGESRVLNLRLELEPLSDRVVVTAQAVPSGVQQTTAPTDVISRETIEDRQAVSLPELLEFSPGIAIGRTGAFGGTASVFLDGGNSNFTKVLVDGTPINPPGSPVDFSSLTTENIDKVEIVRGAESALYGSDAVSGVIQLFTHRGESRIPAFSVYSEGGGFSSARGGADLSGILGKVDYSAAAAYFQTDGQGPNDAFINRTLSGNFGYSFSNTNQLHLSLRNNTSDAGIPGQTLFLPPSLYQGYAQQIFSANGRWEFATGSHWKHQIMGSEAYTRQHSFNPQQSYYATDPDAFCPQSNPAAVPTAEFCDYTYDSLLSYNRAAVNAQTSYISRDFIATAGYQYEVENGGVSFVDPGHLRRNNQAGYLDVRYTPVSRLTLDFGGRVEANDNFGTRFVPRIGGSYAVRYGKGFRGDTRFRAFYGQGIKEPRFDQTFGTDPCYPGNPNLKPEASKNWTAGIDQKLASDRWDLSADYFYYRFYDIVSFGYYPPPNPGFCGSYFNTDLAIARGANLVSQFRVNRWLFIHGNYTYDNSRVVQSPNTFDPSLIPGNHLLRRPVNSGSLGLNLNFARVNWNFIGYFSGVRTDSNFIDPTQTNNPGYARFDMAFSYHFYRGLFFTSRILNLFDKQYQDALGYPALGRWYMLGMRYTFAGRN
ncbi:MAG TPA: TonB-dependent receptor [Candidatus Eisenbacteria bacterium]|nr:TonB-dependent receptor [Candidatus Eisenbacteria bacterium]